MAGDQLWQKMEDDMVVDGRTALSMKGRFQQTIMKNLESYNLAAKESSFLRERKIVKDEEGKVATGQIRSKQNYTKEEDDSIMSWITVNKAQFTTGGTKLWRKMEEEKVLVDRTWESMKKRYSRITKNQKLQGEKEEKEETAEEEDMVGMEDDEENVEQQMDLVMREVEDIEEEVEELHTAYILADI